MCYSLNIIIIKISCCNKSMEYRKIFCVKLY